MGDSTSLSGPELSGETPRDHDDLRAQIQALADFIRNLKQHADRVLGQSARDRAEEDRRSLRETSAQWEEASMRWEKEKEEYDRRWKESQLRWEEIQRDIQRRLDALEGRSSEGSCGEEGTEREGPRDG
jgi:hypothetical protein